MSVLTDTGLGSVLIILIGLAAMWAAIRGAKR